MKEKHPAMRKGAQEEVSAWQKKARERLAELLGLPIGSGAENFRIEWTKDEGTHTEIRFLVEGLLDVYLEIPLGDALGGLDHLVERSQDPLGKDRRRPRTDDGTGDHGGGAGGETAEAAESREDDLQGDVDQHREHRGQEHEGEYDDGQLHAEGFDAQPAAELTPLGSVGSHRRYTAL